jgi:hypothetical protein
VKKFLKGWGFNLSGARKKRKHQIQEELRDLEIMEEHGSLDEGHIKNRVDLKVELFYILEDEELYWYKRCHEDRLLRGDNNTKFYHRVANGKKRKQTTFSMKCGDETITGIEALLVHATKYYKTLFGSGMGNAFALDSSL